MNRTPESSRLQLGYLYWIKWRTDVDGIKWIHWAFKCLVRHSEKVPFPHIEVLVYPLGYIPWNHILISLFTYSTTNTNLLEFMPFIEDLYQNSTKIDGSRALVNLAHFSRYIVRFGRKKDNLGFYSMIRFDLSCVVKRLNANSHQPSTSGCCISRYCH